MKTRSKGRVLFLSVTVLALIIAGCQFFPSYAPFNVRVSVVDQAGQAVNGATVTLRGSISSHIMDTEGGVALIEDVVADNYILAVTYPDGGAGVAYTLSLWGGQDYDIEVSIDDSEDHLIAAWSFEEGTGNEVLDSSKNTHDGKIFGNVSRTDGISGQGLRFDGGYIQVMNSSDFNLDAFTVSLWAKIDNPEDDQKLIGRTPIGNGFIIGFQNKGLRPELWTPGYHDFEAGEISKDEWTHLVVTFQAGIGMTGYINGERVGHVNISGTMASNAHHLIIGANSWGQGHQFKGSMDEVYIYDRVLSLDEIQALAQLGQ